METPEYRAWSKWLEKFFRKLPNISGYQHFSMSADKPGEVIVKKFADSEEETYQLLKRNVKPDDLTRGKPPRQILPEGLSPKRQWYLYDNIRMHIPDEDDKNITAPLPEVRRPDGK